MELEDLKNSWEQLTVDEGQQDFSFKLVDQIEKKKYEAKRKKIYYPEIIGSVICLASNVFIGVSFYKLDTLFLKGIGISAVGLLVLIPLISYYSVRQLTITNFNRPCADVLESFATKKFEFYLLQRINVILGYLLLVTIIILFSKVFSGKDISNNKYFWTLSFSIGFIFLLFFSKFVLKFYESTLNKIEEILKE